MIGDEFIVYYIIGSICLFYSGIICKVVCWYIGKKVDGIGIVIGYVYGVEVVIVYWFWVVDVGGKFGRGIIRVVVYVVLYLQFDGVKRCCFVNLAYVIQCLQIIRQGKGRLFQCLQLYFYGVDIRDF